MKPTRISHLTSYILLLTTCVLLLNTTYAQTIRRVNNNTGVTGVNVYSSAQAAHDAAAANDIIIIEPSATSYGDLVLTKPLKIYGNGYYLDTNTELKADQRSSPLGSIRFNTGSGGSSVYGIDAISSAAAYWYIHGVSNIIIQRCRMGYITILNSNVATTTNTTVSNITITNNYIDGDIFCPGSLLVSNVIVSNNIIGRFMTAADKTNIQNWIVRNNTLTDRYNQGDEVTLANSVFENNLLIRGSSVPAFTNVTFSFNVSASATFSGGIGNQNNFDVASAIVGTGAGISTDEAYQIKAGSPLKTAGSGGTEVGAYGGPTPYVVSGIPAIPSIVNMNNTATGSNTVPLSVTTSVKSNN